MKELIRAISKTCFGLVTTSVTIGKTHLLSADPMGQVVIYGGAKGSYVICSLLLPLPSDNDLKAVIEPLGEDFRTALIELAKNVKEHALEQKKKLISEIDICVKDLEKETESFLTDEAVKNSDENIVKLPN